MGLVIWRTKVCYLGEKRLVFFGESGFFPFDILENKINVLLFWEKCLLSSFLCVMDDCYFEAKTGKMLW